MATKTKVRKLYFRDIDSTTCYPLNNFISEAIGDELEEITLIEAVRDKDEKDYIFCGWAGEVGERSECTKKNCDQYTPNKSGRGVCVNRGKLYTFGEEVAFKVEDLKQK